MTTLKDIANHLGLSRATVSRALNGYPEVNEETKRRVAEAAVGSYPTLSPLPPANGRRFAFCGAIPRVAPGGSYPPPFHRGARTFLDGREVRRDRPAVWRALDAR